MPKQPWKPWIGRPRDPPQVRRDDPIERLIDEVERTLAELEPVPRSRPGRKSKKTQATAAGEKS